MARLALALALAVSLGACAHTQPPITSTCLHLTPYTDANKAALKAAFDALPSQSPLRDAVKDLQKLRAEARAACGP